MNLNKIIAFAALAAALASPAGAAVYPRGYQPTTRVQVYEPHQVHIVAGQGGRINIWVTVWMWVWVSCPIAP